MIVSRNKKEKKLEVQRLGAKFSPEMLGDSDIKRKHHLSNKKLRQTDGLAFADTPDEPTTATGDGT